MSQTKASLSSQYIEEIELTHSLESKRREENLNEKGNRQVIFICV